jgi:hypothetical protein
VIHTNYFSTNFDQKPLTNYFFPIMDNIFLNEEDPLFKKERYHFSFLYKTGTYLNKQVENYLIDKRFFNMLMRQIMQIKINQIGVHTRQFFSEDLTKIFMVLKCQENVLKMRAEVSLKLALS